MAGDVVLSFSKKISISVQAVASVNHIEDGDIKDFNLLRDMNKEEPQYVAFSNVNKLWRLMKKYVDKNTYLHELLEGSEIVLPQLEVHERNPELEIRIQQLKAAQNEHIYQKMTKSLDKRGKQAEDIGAIGIQVKAMNSQLSVVFNFIVTVVAAFAFGYKALEYTTYADTGMKLLSGLILGTIVFFADLYFVVKNDSVLNS